MSFEIMIKVAVKATQVSQYFAVHPAMNVAGVTSQGDRYCLTHIPTGYVACQSAKLSFLSTVVDELEKRCPPLDSDNVTLINNLIPESLAQYLHNVSNGATYTYLDYCSKMDLTPAPEWIRSKTPLQKLLDADF